MIVIILLFIVWFFAYANKCSCKKETKECYRTEFYGFQYGHLLLYTPLGAMYPKQFWFWIILGIVWEIFEYWLSMHPDLVQKLGGCLSKSEEETPLWYRHVYAGTPKYENFIDKTFDIKNSHVHTWHYSIGENLTNVIGFLIGQVCLELFSRIQNL
jgi:hypothetical protein